MLASVVGVLLPRGQQETQCSDFTHVKIEVGSTVFSVPRTYDLFVSGKAIPNNFNTKHYCPKRADEVLNADDLTFLSAHSHSSDGYKSASIAGLQITVGDRGLSYWKPEEWFELKAGYLKKIEIDFATLMRKHGFRAHEVETGTNLYFALGDAGTVETVPLIIECGSPAVIIGGKNIGRRCSTGYYPLSEDLVVSYRFRDAGHRVETWANLNQRVREFVRSFAISDAWN